MSAAETFEKLAWGKQAIEAAGVLSGFLNVEDKDKGNLPMNFDHMAQKSLDAGAGQGFSMSLPKK